MLAPVRPKVTTAQKYKQNIISRLLEKITQKYSYMCEGAPVKALDFFIMLAVRRNCPV